MENVLAQPYYGDKKIRFYDTANPIASSPLYELDLSSDITSNWGSDCSGAFDNSFSVRLNKRQ